MSHGVLEAANNKWNKLAKKLNETTAAEVIVCDDSGYDVGGG